MAQPVSEKPTDSKLYRDYFDDPTLSDLTIRLGNKTVRTHRIVLCRGSEYFAKLLTGRFQETEFDEVELHDDDPDAMVALLRFLYDLPYSTDDTERWTKTLKPHAAVYAVADKYQIEPLKSHVYEEMQKIARSSEYLGTEAIDEDGMNETLKNKVDFVDALRIIYTDTPTKDSQGRN